MKEDQYFHFTLGPVQGFVAQARRTRDFWAGSFLLSYLSAIAMTAVEKQGGKLLFPKVESHYLNWLENRGKGLPPQQGCIPNRFKGGTAEVPGDFNPRQVETSVQQAWRGLAEAVWEHDLADYAGTETRTIWDRQVNNFWEMSWVITDSEERSDLLDRRKNWRSYLPPEEQGVKCMMMDGWQELSAIQTPNAKGLALFWQGLRQQKGRSLKNDLRENEYLCAIAFIKRRFSHVFNHFQQAMPENWTAHGWSVNPSVPSVSYIAAAPWLAKVIGQAADEAIAGFVRSAKKLSADYGKTTTEITCLTQALTKRGATEDLLDLVSLEGDVFFESLLDNKINETAENSEQAQQVKTALKNMLKGQDLEVASPFYAVLMMDGDSLGAQMSDLNKQQAISSALNHFTNGVADIVEQHSGFLIYAGGDDVLALLPLEYALNCANALRNHYLDSFKQHGQYSTANAQGQVQSTLSGAIEYAHIKMPLGKILADAHQLLDAVAKDEYGRDAIAVRVWKPGGQHLQWAMPWQYAVNEDNQVILNELANDFRKTEQQTPFSSSFFFNIDTRFAMLQNKQHGQWQLAEGFDEQSITTLIAAEYLNAGININRNPKLTLDAAKQHIAPLIEQCLPKYRNAGSGRFVAMNRLNVDAAHLLRFLANKGVDHG